MGIDSTNGDEELGSWNSSQHRHSSARNHELKQTIGAGPGVCHGEKIRFIMLLNKVLVRELFTVDRLSTSPLFSKIPLVSYFTQIT